MDRTASSWIGRYISEWMSGWVNKWMDKRVDGQALTALPIVSFQLKMPSGCGPWYGYIIESGMICGMVSSCIMVLRKQKVKATFKTSFPLEMSEQRWEPGCVHLNPFKRREGVCVLRSVFPGDWEPPPLTEFNVLCKDQDGSQLNHERKKPGTPSLTQLHSGGVDSFYIICLMSVETQSSHWDFIYMCVYIQTLSGFQVPDPEMDSTACWPHGDVSQSSTGGSGCLVQDKAPVWM